MGWMESMESAMESGLQLLDLRDPWGSSFFGPIESTKAMTTLGCFDAAGKFLLLKGFRLFSMSKWTAIVQIKLPVRAIAHGSFSISEYLMFFPFAHSCSWRI